MDKLTHKRWDEAIERLGNCPKEKRDHFATLIMQLADCYGEDHTSKAVILIDHGEVLAMFSAGADEMAAADMVSKAHEVFMANAVADAPPKELFN
jgi:hypothetical protein